MTVYIDDWGHLFSDKNITELWALAERIGMKADWNHYSKGFPHFDLTTAAKKQKAAKAGAVQISVRDQLWRDVTDAMNKSTFNRSWHESIAVCCQGTGLVGQKILRLDIPATIAREKDTP